MEQFSYRAKQNVQAAQWKEHNLEEMKILLKDIVTHNQWDGPEVYADYIEPYFLHSLGDRGGYHMLQFYAGDDIEVDPGMWVIVYEDGEVEIMDDFQFTKMFEKI